MIWAIVLGSALAAGPDASEVTIYNQGFALVKEVRMLDLKQGEQTLRVEDVAQRIEPSSVGIRSITNPGGLQVLEQNYQYDLISPMAILNKSVGQKIRFIRTIGNARDVLEGTLLNAPTAIVNSPDGGSTQTFNGMVIKTDDGRIVLSPSGEIEVGSVPEGLIARPSLMWMVDSGQAGQNTIELSYLTQGMNWNADYVLQYDGIGSGDLKGWVTVNNQCGVGFKDAKLKLLAGDVARAQEPRPPRAMAYGGAMKVTDQATFQEQALFEYHLYTLQRPATLANNETKQLSLLEGKGIKVTKRVIVDSLQDMGSYFPGEGEIGTGDIKPQVRLEFVNSKDNGLGIPLPKGKIKVYQRDDSGSVQMLGEAAIDHTPRDEKLSLVVGKAFDIRATRKRTDFQRLGDRAVQETFEISVRNRKDTPETVQVLERHWGDWNVTQKNMDFTKLDSQTMDFEVSLKPNEEKKVVYTIITKW